LKPPGQSEFFVQPDLSFNAGDMFMFDVSDPTMSGFSLVFGTTVDVSNSVIPEVVQVDGTTIILDISAGYTGGALYYFEDTSAGMGYGVPPTSTQIVMDFGTIDPGTSSSLINSSKNNTILNNFIDSYGFDYDYTEVNFTGENVTTPGVKNHPELDSNTYLYTKAINLFSSFTNIAYLQKTVNTSGTFSVWYGYYGGSTPAYITKNDEEKDTISSSDQDKIQRRVDISVTSGDIIRIYEGWCIMYLYAISYPEAIAVPPYIVTVSGDPDVFYIDETPQPNLTFTAGETYVFDQSDPLNTGNQLVLGTVPDLSSSMISYQTVVGTPGQPGAYTTFTATEETVYYFSYETPDMGIVVHSPLNFADVVTSTHTGLVNPPVLNPNMDVNHLLDLHGFTYQYTNLNYEGEGIERPGGNGDDLDSNTYSYTKAITMFYYGSTEGYIEKTVNASGTLKVVYGTTNFSTGAVAIDTGSGYVEVDTVNGVKYKEFTTTISAGDKFKVYEKDTSIIFLYAIEYPQ